MTNTDTRTENARYIDIAELAAIRDKKLYRAEFQTFEEYCLERWEWTQQRAGQIIRAAKCARMLETIVSISPARESHIRPLLEKLDNDKDREHVWSRVVARHERITAAMVESEIAQFQRWVSEIKLRAGVRIGEISSELEKAPSGKAAHSLPTGGKSKSQTLKSAGLSTSVAEQKNSALPPGDVQKSDTDDDAEQKNSAPSDGRELH